MLCVCMCDLHCLCFLNVVIVEIYCRELQDGRYFRGVFLKDFLSESSSCFYLAIFLAWRKSVSSCLMSCGHREKIVPFLPATFMNLKTAVTPPSTTKCFLPLGKQPRFTQRATCHRRMCFPGHSWRSPMLCPLGLYLPSGQRFTTMRTGIWHKLKKSKMMSLCLYTFV